MPAGGGAGGGGGGGFSGFSRSRSFDRDYHHTRRGSAGGEDCNCNKRVAIPLAIVLSVIVFVVLSIIIPTIIIGVIQTRPPPSLFSPGDTRIVSYGISFLCAGITLTDSSSRVGSSLYLITETPPLSDRNSFTINSTLQLPDNIYNYWNYYLYPNSNFTTELCTLPNSANGVFYLIKGKGPFDSWINEPSTDRAIGFFSIGDLPCSDPRHRFSFQVEEEDEYYFVYYNRRGDSQPFLRLDVTISVERFEYSTADLESVANCSVAESVGECTLTVPYGSNYRALIATDIPSNPDWEENVDIKWHCVDRGWAYAVVVLVPILSVAGCIAAVLLTILCCILVRKKLRQSPSFPHISSEKEVTVRDEPTECLPPEVTAAAASEDDDFKSVDPS